MIGAIAGDIIGSVYEADPIKTTDFPLFQESSTFTDDTVLTVATAYSILKNEGFTESFKKFGRSYPYAGYGFNFMLWLCSNTSEPYNSWGNGSAMRVSPVGFAFNSTDDVLEQAKRSAEVTHNHPEGIKGAQATALSVFLAGKGENKEAIKKEITKRFNYDLNRTVDKIRPAYQFDVSCQGTVPEAIICFLESDGFEDAIRNAVSLGGDSDTLACITGGIAQAYYKHIPPDIVTEVQKRLPHELLDIVNEFNAEFIKPEY
jgi:ADP-ribosylglycohydrolase